VIKRFLRWLFFVALAGLGVALIFHGGNADWDAPWTWFWGPLDMIVGLVLFISAADHLGWFWERDRSAGRCSSIVEGRCGTCGGEVFEGDAGEVVSYLDDSQTSRGAGG